MSTPPIDSAKDENPNIGSAKRDGSVFGDEEIIPSLTVIQDWTFTWPRVMARAWIDKTFKTLLLENAEKAFELMGFTNPPLIKNTKLTLWSLLDIKVIEPDQKEIVIKRPDPNPSKATYMPPITAYENIESYLYNGWTQAMLSGQLKMYLTIVLPPAPEPEYQALAVIDYQAAGKVFPITFGF